ncbi:MAG: LrgB family protein [Alphaproteobacteria bacterium]|nr:LrgB family protein [Alphaproteobacteria bacterium]
MSILSLPPIPDDVGLFWLFTTCLLYALAVQIRAKLGGSLYAQPLLWVAALLLGGLYWADIALSDYQKGGDWLLLALALSTTAIAAPIYSNRHIIRAAAKPFLASLLVGSSAAVILAVASAYILGLDDMITATLATRTTTTPIAMGLADEIGGLPVLAMLIAIFAGNITVLMAPFLFRLVGVVDVRAQGVALGVIGSGIGTAEAVRQSHLAGSFAGLAMGVNGVLTGALLPLFF